MRRMAMAAVLAAALLVTLGLDRVSADPVNNPHAEVITLNCAGEEIEIVVGGGLAAHVVDGTGVLIPTAFSFVGTFVDPETGEATQVNESFTIGQGKRVGLQDDLFTCTFPINEEGFTGTGTVTLFATPRGR